MAIEYDGTDLNELEKQTTNGMDAAIAAVKRLQQLSSDTGIDADAGKMLGEALGGTNETMKVIEEKSTNIHAGVQEKQGFERNTADEITNIFSRRG